jgi:hypothetical protein
MRKATLTLPRVQRAKEAIHTRSDLKTAFLIRDVQRLALPWIIHVPYSTMGVGCEMRLSKRGRSLGSGDKKQCAVEAFER